MLVFMKHTGVARRLFIEVPPPAVAAAGESRQQRITQIPRMKKLWQANLIGVIRVIRGSEVP